jgi:hypothetical protein
MQVRPPAVAVRIFVVRLLVEDVDRYELVGVRVVGRHVGLPVHRRADSGLTSIGSPDGACVTSMEGQMLKLAAAGAMTLGALVTAPLLLAAAGLTGGGPPSEEALAEIPPDYLAIYQDAVFQRCPTLPWSVLAAIGSIESNHGRHGGGQLQTDGRVSPPIIGIPLDGTNGTAEIRDTDDGVFDGDSVYDRAVGPMQFIPSTWATSGVDASGDGVADPHNAIDAIHAAAGYLCAVGADDPTDIRGAIWSYNHSWDYVDAVLAQSFRYVSDTPSRVRVATSGG